MKTRKREIDGLVEAMKAFSLEEGLIITFENEEDITVEGTGIIHVIPAWKWMLQV